MADNRMELRHIPTGETFRIATFYYATGWYLNVETDDERIKFVKQLDNWLATHVDNSDDLLNGGANYIIEYETGDPAKAEYQENITESE